MDKKWLIIADSAMFLRTSLTNSFNKCLQEEPLAAFLPKHLEKLVSQCMPHSTWIKEGIGSAE
jgi:hypothetical protein